MKVSLASYDEGLAQCYEAESAGWKILLQSQLTRVTDALVASDKIVGDRVMSAKAPMELAQRKWEDWVKADAEAASAVFGSGTLAYSQFSWTHLELTARRAIELHNLAEMLTS